jgi:hypothetical protein
MNITCILVMGICPFDFFDWPGMGLRVFNHAQEEQGMAKIYLRERRHIGKGAGRPRFAIAAVEGLDLRVYSPHWRKAELEALAAQTGAELIYLPRGEKAPEEGEEDSGPGQGRGRRSRWNRTG